MSGTEFISALTSGSGIANGSIDGANLSANAFTTIAASTALTGAYVQQTDPRVARLNFNILKYGAVADGSGTTGGMSTGQSVFTATAGVFTSGDVGKLFAVQGAGGTGTLNFLLTTILSVDSATQVTLASPAINTVVGASAHYGTDNTAAITSAIAAAELKGGRVFCPPGQYCIGSNITVTSHVDFEGQSCGDATFQGFHGGTQFYCMTPSAGFTFLSYARVIERFTLEGGGIATQPMTITAVQSTFRDLAVARADGDNIVITGANSQNCLFSTIQSNDCNVSALVLDNSAGGMAFVRCEFFNTSGWTVDFRQSVQITGTYGQPTDISFWGCEMEHDGSATFGTTSVGYGRVHIGAGLQIAFHDTFFQQSVAGDIIQLDQTGAASSSTTGPVFDNCFWALTSSVTNCIHVTQQISGGCVFLGRQASTGSAATFMTYDSNVTVRNLVYGALPSATTLFASGAGSYTATDAFRSAITATVRATTQSLTQPALEAKYASDTFPRGVLRADGSLNFGAGSTDTDTAISRTAAGALQVNGTFKGTALAASGLTGATGASRYVGATTSGAPASGTFAKGDFIVDQSGSIWVCTSAGTPGTWVSSAPSGIATGGLTTTLITANGTYSIPAGATLLEVIAVGGGAGGGGGGSPSSAINQVGGAGGTSGSYVQQLIPVGSNTSLTVAIGTGGSSGAAGTAGGNAGGTGGSGGTTTVTGTGISVSAVGGRGSAGSTASSTSGVLACALGATSAGSTANGQAGVGSSSGSVPTAGGPPIGYTGGAGSAGGAANSTTGGAAGSAGTANAGGAAPGAAGSGTSGATGMTGTSATANTGCGGGGGGGGANGGAGGAGGVGGSGFVIVKVVG